MDLELFRLTFLQKIRYNKIKRLYAIEGYLFENFGMDVAFDEDDIEMCWTVLSQIIIDNPESANDIVTDIAKILHDRYSIGEPFFFIGIETNNTKEELAERLNDIFADEISYDSFDFTNSEVAVDEVSDTFYIKTRYNEYYVDPVTGDRGSSIYSGGLSLSFDLETKLSISSITGYHKAVNKLIELINDRAHPYLKLRPKHIQRSTRHMTNAATSQFDSLTMLIIYLVFSKFEEIGFGVISVNSLSFDNLEAPRVKTAKLGGTDLFSDPDVVERIYNGDKITKLTLSVVRLNIETGSALFTSDLTIDFKGTLKFIFDDSSNYDVELLTESCKIIYSGIIEAIEYDKTIDIASNKLHSELQRRSFTNIGAFNGFAYALKQELVGLMPENKERIEEYFLQKYQV